jgi:thiamine pyrophosphate-dependent acetolactate synthase large subunit-like protein
MFWLSGNLATMACGLPYAIGAQLAFPDRRVVPDESPHCTGGVGLLGTRPSREALEGCDTSLIVDSSFPYTEFYPNPGQARCVH